MIYSLSEEASENGELVVPIRQGEDPGLKSGGVCRAMTYEWAKARLKNQPYQGFSLTTQRLPLIPDNTITRKFPWVNTRIGVTPELQRKQDLGSAELARELDMKLITQATGNALQSPTILLDTAYNVSRENYGICILGVTSHARSEPVAPKPTPRPAPVGVGQGTGFGARPTAFGARPSGVNAGPTMGGRPKPLLGTHRPVAGHALGFRIIGNANEFFDANSGWYSFSSFQRLQQFFVRYIGVTGMRSEYGGPWEMWSIV